MANVYRPYESKDVKEKIDAFTNKLGLTNINRSQLSNLCVGIGINCLEKTFDAMLDKVKQKDYKNDFIKLLQ
jgi:hypothetical protein